MKFLNEFMAEAMDAEAMKDAKEKERQRRKAQKEEQNERRAKAAEERAQINARKGREEKNKQADEDEERKEKAKSAQEARYKTAAKEKITDRKTGVGAGLKRELGGDFIGVRASEEEKKGLEADKKSDAYKKAVKEKEERERQNRAAREKAFGRAIKKLGRGAGSVSDAIKSTVTKGEVSQEGGQTTGGSKLTSRRKDG